MSPALTNGMQITCKLICKQVLILQRLPRPSTEQQGGTLTQTLANSSHRIIATRCPPPTHPHPQLGPRQELEARAGQAGRWAVGTAEQAVSQDYLLCFGAELSGSRWG